MAASVSIVPPSKALKVVGLLFLLFAVLFISVGFGMLDICGKLLETSFDQFFPVVYGDSQQINLLIDR